MNLYQNLNQSIQCDRYRIRTYISFWDYEWIVTQIYRAFVLSHPYLYNSVYHSPPGHLPVFPSSHFFILVRTKNPLAAETGVEPVTLCFCRVVANYIHSANLTAIAVVQPSVLISYQSKSLFRLKKFKFKKTNIAAMHMNAINVVIVRRLEMRV